MPSSKSPLWCVIALSLAPSLAVAEPLSEWAKQRVEQGLIQPLVKSQKDRSKYSRARIQEPERRVRVSQSSFSTDEKGRKFVNFSVDAKYGDEWESNHIMGCVYQGSANIYVKIGEEHYPAGFLLGKEVAPVLGVCAAVTNGS